MKITLRDFLKLYNFKQIIEDDDHLETKIVRIYYDQPIYGTDDGRWFEFGVNDHYVTPEKEDIIEKVISKDVLSQLVKSATVTEYDACNQILRIDTFACNDSFNSNCIEDDKEDTSNSRGLDKIDEDNIHYIESLKNLSVKKNKAFTSTIFTERQLMFLKQLKDDWKYILEDGDYERTIVSEDVIYKNKYGQWDYVLGEGVEEIDDPSCNFPLKENRIYIIEDLINGVYDKEFAIDLYGDYNTTKNED